MRTTINLDPTLIDDVIRLTGEKDRGKAVNKAMDEFVRHAKVEKLIALAGHIDIEDNWEEMEKLELDKMARREW